MKRNRGRPQYLPPDGIEFDMLPEIGLLRKEVNGHRHYYHPDFPNILYPSVTSVISQMSPDDGGLERWKEAVGRDKAEQISQLAMNRGTAIHNAFEKWWLRQPLDKIMPSELKILKDGIPILLENVTKIRGIEFGLNSNILNSAGTADLLCDWHNVPAVLDYKTARRSKREEWIHHYFLQSTAYAIMLEEKFGIICKYIIILIFPDDGPPQKFVKSVADYRDEVLDMFTKFQGFNVESSDNRTQ